MWAGFAAQGRSRLNSRKHHWTAPVELTAVQPGPWLYRGSTAPPENTQKQNKREGPSPDSQRESHKNQTAKGKQQEPKRGKTERGDGDKSLPTANEFLGAKAKTKIVG